MGKNKHNALYEQSQIIIENDNYVNISEEDLQELDNLYHFIKKGNQYFDRKRNKVVNTRQNSILYDGIMNNFSKNWLKKELFCTKSQTILKIVKNNPLLFDIYKSYCDKLASEKYPSLIDKDDLEDER